MISGRDALGYIDRALQDEQGKLSEVEKRISDFNEHRVGLQQAQVADFRDLARLRVDMIAQGDPIARIVNVFGDTLAQLEAPADGMFFGLRALPNVTTGDWCCFFCKVEGTRD